MRKTLSLLSLCCLILASGPFALSARAEDKTVLAVVDFAILNVELESSQPLTDVFRQELAKNSTLEIIPRDKVDVYFDKIDPVLKLKLEQTDCTNAACAIGVGRELQANKTILGSINKKEGLYVITAKIFNLDERDVDYIASEESSNKKNLEKLAKSLAGRISFWFPKPGETTEQVKARLLAQEKKEQAAKEKKMEEERKKLSQRKAGTCPEGMVLIPAAEFTNGAGKKVKVAEYCIDIYEFPNKKDKRPLTKIEWFGAKEECEKQGKRLCSEAEWERACSGAQGNKYPYGNDYAASKCNTADSGKPKRVSKSGECSECVSSYGVYDMSGNAVEWTADRYGMTYATKGGSYNNKVEKTSCGAVTDSMPFSRRKDNGFRCCK